MPGMLIRLKKSLKDFLQAYQCSGVTLINQPIFITKNGQPISGQDIPSHKTWLINSTPQPGY